MPLSKETCAILKVCKPLLEEHKVEIGSVFYEKLFTEHPGLKSMFNMSHQAGEDGKPGRQQFALGQALVSYCTHCDTLENLGSFVERVANKHVSFDVQPEQYPVVGGLLLATLEQVLGKDVFTEDVKNAVADAYFFLADIFISKETGIKEKLMSTEGGWTGWRKMKVVDKIVEAPLYTSLLFAPADDGPLMQYLPGQYISLKLDLPIVDDGSHFSTVRNYSLSDAPGSGRLRITVKKDGVASSHLHNLTTIGDIIEMGVPCGDFVLQPGSECVFLAAGVGITPILSIIKESARKGNKVNFEGVVKN